MEIETLFADQKWNIISELSKKHQSPLQLSEKLNTTMANISQQLRLLEAFDIVKKQKISNRDKGKPRSLFSLKKDYAYIISASENFAEKKLIQLDPYQKILLKILFIEDSSLRYFTEKAFWKLEQYIDQIEFLSLKEENNKAIFTIISNQSKEIEKKIQNITVKNSKGESKTFDMKYLDKSQIKKHLISTINNQIILYNPGKLIEKEIIP